MPAPCIPQDADQLLTKLFIKLKTCIFDSCNINPSRQCRDIYAARYSYLFFYKDTTIHIKNQNFGIVCVVRDK